LQSSLLPHKARASFSLDRDLRKKYPKIKGGKGNYLFTADGRKIFDASSGAAVSCIGYGNKKIITAINKIMKTGTPYLASTF
jgi:adenosylmethionine-8-amino-7-oxononanoate aminotransferase